MTTQTTGLIIGGLIPAVLFSFSNIFMKGSMERGTSFAIYLISVGIAVLAIGTTVLFITRDRGFNVLGSSLAFMAGLSWAIGVSGAIYAIHKFDTPLGKLAPLFNMNTLFTVLFALWIFAEWKEVKMLHLLMGSFLIVIGGILVARA